MYVYECAHAGRLDIFKTKPIFKYIIGTYNVYHLYTQRLIFKEKLIFDYNYIYILYACYQAQSVFFNVCVCV